MINKRLHSFFEGDMKNIELGFPKALDYSRLHCTVRDLIPRSLREMHTNDIQNEALIKLQRA